MFGRFREVFGRSLHEFWLDNAQGLNLSKFDRELVGAGKQPLLQAVKTRWGTAGRDIVKRLLPKPLKRRVRRSA